MGQDVFSLEGADLRKLRQDMQMIFQDPYSSLNPRHTIGKIVGEPLLIHGIGSKKQRAQKVAALMETVGMRPEILDR